MEKKTVQSFMSPLGRLGGIAQEVNQYSPDKPAELDRSEPGVFIVRLICNPDEIEILDGMCVYERRVIAHNSSQAVAKVIRDVRRS